MQEKLVKGLNADFIAWIPKKTNPEVFFYYQPISLIGSVYKLISKLLAGSFQRVMPYVI